MPALVRYYFDSIAGFESCGGVSFCLVGIVKSLQDIIFLKGTFIGVLLEGFHGEFDPGSGRTLAACLTHASRTMKPACWWISGERVSNTWVICPKLWDKPGKLGLIPNMTDTRMGVGGKLRRFGMGPRPISLLVG